MSTSGLKKLLSTFINDAGSNGDQDDGRDPQKITLNKKEAGGLESKNLNDNCAKKKFKCDYCEKKFDRKFNLSRHNESRIVQECAMCGIVLCNQYDIKRHITNSHK